MDFADFFGAVATLTAQGGGKAWANQSSSELLRPANKASLIAAGSLVQSRSPVPLITTKANKNEHFFLLGVPGRWFTT